MSSVATLKRPFPRASRDIACAHSTRRLLTWAIGLLLVPIFVLGFLFVRENEEKIAFASKEVEGVRLLRVALPVLSELASPYEPLPKADALARIEGELADGLLVADEVRDIGAALAAETTRRDEIIEKMLGLIGKVGETSNLILDPELQSYYLMSTLVERMPALLAHVKNTTMQLITLRKDPASYADTHAAAIYNVHRLMTITEELERSYRSAFAADPDGQLSRQLEGPIASLRWAVKDYGAAAIDPLGQITDIELAMLRDLTGRVHAQAVALSATGADELERLLTDRVTARYWALVLGLMLSSIVTCVAVFISHRALRHVVNQLDDRIVFLAGHDSLTGLKNRRVFLEALDAMNGDRGNGMPFAVLCLDLDRFKAVNDTLGHPIGDQLLRIVAARLRSSIRETDVLGRFGGDEFVILLRGPNAEEAAQAVASEVISELSRPFEVEGHLVSIGTSVGIVVTRPGELERTNLMQMADIALYRAKSGGRGTYRFFETGMEIEVQERRMLELDLRSACAKGEFELNFQPLVNTETSEVVCCEALIRWNHPKRGRVAPDKFIALAEEIGVIDEIGAWVLREACRAAVTWPDHVRVAVNISAVQFRSGKLIGAVNEAIVRYGLKPDRLELEITESVLIHDTDATLAILGALKEIGVRISMDDFGTGYSSLSYLRKFPFDKLKIDRSFVADLDNGRQPVAIVRAVTELAASLGMCTTAEGVETAKQREALAELSCTEIQGYLISKPLQTEQISAFLWDGEESAQRAA